MDHRPADEAEGACRIGESRSNYSSVMPGDRTADPGKALVFEFSNGCSMMQNAPPGTWRRWGVCSLPWLIRERCYGARPRGPAPAFVVVFERGSRALIESVCSSESSNAELAPPIGVRHPPASRARLRCRKRTGCGCEETNIENRLLVDGCRLRGTRCAGQQNDKSRRRCLLDASVLIEVVVARETTRTNER